MVQLQPGMVRESEWTEPAGPFGLLLVEETRQPYSFAASAAAAAATVTASAMATAAAAASKVL